MSQHSKLLSAQTPLNLQLIDITPKEFQTKLIQWQQVHGRLDLPWQKQPSPYAVLVSEIMLQQTQVATVIPYFERWMNKFQDTHTLAKASEDEVMHYWQGLGYYSRARNLRKAAIYIEDTHQGIFPSTLEEILKIPGVGPYTAGAIMSFAFNRYGPIVDGNVKRFFTRLFGIEGVPSERLIEKKIWQISEYMTPNKMQDTHLSQDEVKAKDLQGKMQDTHLLILDANIEESPANYTTAAPDVDISNRSFAQGLLDMGATVCKAKTPLCEACVFQTNCVAYQENIVDKLPTPKPKKVTPTKEGHFIWLEKDNRLLLEKRAADGIWGALWCLPQVYLQAEEIEHIAKVKGKFNHVFSHYKLKAQVWELTNMPLSENQKYFSLDEIKLLGLPTPIKKFIEKNIRAE